MTIMGGRDVRIRKLAIEVLRTYGVPHQRWREEAVALFEYTRKTIRYTRDPIEHDTYVAAVRTVFDWKGGDCDDMAIALGALLLAVGFRVVLILIQTRGNTSYNHIYLAAVMPDGSELPLDPTVDRPAGWEAPDEVVVKRLRVLV